MVGKFISFEGPEGAGKTSVLKVLIPRLQAQYGPQLLVTREPGGTDNPVAEAIRDLVLSPDYPTMDIRTEALLYAASRREHIQKTIKPALVANKIVLSDRFVDSSIAYQGAGRGIGFEAVRKLNDFVLEGFLPDCTIYFDIRPEVGLARIKAHRQNEINRLDLDPIEFHQRVSAGYHQLAKQDPKRIIIIDAEQPIEQVIEDAWQVVNRILKMEE
ncbi:dTMP kinase [Weissella koreensis]|uniref:Thymidylate kinase n=1 Tax=Weissella koreensis TaxID=165096 RepID=A0A7H1MM77_9LACO|nr:dTMP kinase [Weissella koreensis]AVH75358.1 dTMP kinase [Weissella koreensis]EJF34862.1 thymidylate kinase [Weissella koreensis KCTC 3621]MCZ9311209.1 dTMP kinase [Weissella koreensis]QGN20584.1 dTMP kinase [Weissella koreensis]QNT64563.1 dTMP kinase [Weissella koreensis]